MPKWGYSWTEFDPERMVRASAREVSVSHKVAREVCRYLVGMPLDKAKECLNEVIEKKRPIPFTRFKKKVGHRRGVTKAFAGRYPVKTAKVILKLLEGAEANAEYNGFDTEALRIIHASAYPGRKLKNYIPRAFGRSSPHFDTLCHIELILGLKEGS